MKIASAVEGRRGGAAWSAALRTKSSNFGAVREGCGIVDRRENLSGQAGRE
jgi:hypothetical protein